MRLEDLQNKRNKEARQLRSIENKKERQKKAFKLGNKYEQIGAKHGFITQSHYWVHVYANLKD